MQPFVSEESAPSRAREPSRDRCARLRRAWQVGAALWAAVAGLGAAPPVWHQETGYRWMEAQAPSGGRAGFTLLRPEATGVGFTNHLAEATSALNRILENGSGVALGDVDGDGWCDIYLCRLEGPNALYRNLGNWRFEEVTQAAGVACPDQYSTGAVLADIDGDGDLDLLVNALGAGTQCFLNDGRGHFTEVTETRLLPSLGATSMALADIDGDGDLDLYVTNYRTTTYKDRPPGLKVEARRVDGRIVVSPEDRFIPLMPRGGGVEVMERGEPDVLYINAGRGRFAPVSWTSGAFVDEEGQRLAAAPADWGLSVAFRDLNGDLAPDIYVCNDFFYFPDRVWLNEAGRGFRALPRFALRNVSLSSMGMDFADIDRDGHDDFFVADMVSRNHAWRQRQRPNMMQGLMRQPLEDMRARPETARNTLAWNRGDGTYAEIAQFSGVDFSEWSWGAVFLDVDLDGYEDLIVPTGNNHDVQDADVLRGQARIREEDTLQNRLRRWREYPALATPIVAFRNRHDLTFAEAGPEWGFSEPGPFQGLALADLDHDGDLDIVVNRLSGFAGLYRNESGAARVGVRLKGAGGNTRGIGAKIQVTGGPVSQSQEMMCGGRYLSGDDSLRVFAAGSPTNRLRLEVAWRSGRRSVVEQAVPGRIYEIDESGPPAGPAPAKSPAAPLFADASDRLACEHVDTPFDDFERQPLLSRRLSSLGPGVAWGDLDGDGWDDLLIGSGRGGRLRALRNDRQGGFVPLPGAWPDEGASDDSTTVLCWSPAPGRSAILAGWGNYAGGRTNRAAVGLYALGTADVTGFLPEFQGTPGPLALADVDGDGLLDLFVGARAIPGRYPTAGPSWLCRGAPGGAFLTASNELERLAPACMVSGAVFSDLDQDGLPELILACEWGPIRVLKRQQGAWREIGAQLGLDRWTGWWNGVTTADLNGDGRLDIVASNWGRNTRFRRFLARPLRLYYGDLREEGGVDLLEAWHEPALNKWVCWRDYESVCRALPFVSERAPTFRAYGEASVEELLGERLARAAILEAATLDSMVFLNRGGRFEARPLPVPAQLAPAFGVAVADFDGDGKEDLFLSQNFFDVEPETSRYDAGLGLWLRGDGEGGFTVPTVQESGIRVYGQQRGCAVCDYDGDGRPDLVVAQNRGAIRLWHNARARLGLRVRLAGPPGNPAAIGAVLRLKSGDRFGPAREVRAGAGYWSQDSAVQVLALPETPTQLQVRWPGGKTTVSGVPAGAREIVVEPSGSVKEAR